MYFDLDSVKLYASPSPDQLKISTHQQFVKYVKCVLVRLFSSFGSWPGFFLPKAFHQPSCFSILAACYHPRIRR